MEYQDQPANPEAYLPPRPGSEAEERAKDLRARLAQDMHTTAVTHGLTDMPTLLDALVEDAMFQIEHLLMEVEALHMKDRAKSSVTEPLGWPHD